jgi:hypothetical protein
MKKCIAVFDTTYETLRAEDFFRQENVRFRPILKPRKIGSACRMALQFSCGDIGPVKKAVRAGNLALKGFYEKEGEGWKERG